MNRPRGVGAETPKFTGSEPCTKVPDVFHPDKNDYRSGAIAKWICHRCPMQEPCLLWAMSDPSLIGIHAGTTDKQRSAMRGKIRRDNA